MKTFVNKKPNKNTQEAFKEANDIMCGKIKAKKYKNASELREDLKV